ncbi:hypothetical protein BBG10_05510 [Streptococcus dysgalactiae subsp. equisimilis]|uniref:hypothetical protein n=1 Tax=Streptococcus dysgalactiae TaxID=1334 RepID=UPI000825E3F3|nr:hypothetical protein [Streptococcus dysgalactiae]OCX02217.1 hypothetical protein BBG10_05510 [Streptococcus dysgalactiae subsp. equisimilis]
MAVQEIPDTYFYRLDSQSIDGTLLQKASLVVDQFYIKIDDYYSFYTDQDVDVYKIISSTQADVYKANKYNYQSSSKPDTSVTKPPTAIGLYQSITIDGRAIGRVICNNKVIWQNTNATPQKTNEWQSLWSGILSINEVRLPAYKTYGFRSGPHQIFKRAEDLIGLYDSLNGNTLVARFDSIANELIVSGFGQSTVEIFGKN